MVWIDPNGCTRDPDYGWDFARACAETRSLLAAQPFLYALDVVAARTIGKVAPLPFAGDPLWSPEVQQVITQAQDIGRTLRQNIGTVALLVGLLRISGGLTYQLWQVLSRQPTHDADRLLARLKKATGNAGATSQLTKNSGFVLDTACSQTKRADSPWILECHLLDALLATPSAALDGVLRSLETHRETLRAILQRLHYFSGAHGLPSDFPPSG